MALRELRLRVPRSLIIEVVALPLPLRSTAEVGSLLRDLFPDRPYFPYPPLREIGAGGMGTVCAARHLRLGRPVAVKLLSRELKAVPEAFERFRQEARLASSLGSRHIIDVLDFNEDEEGAPYMVMEMLQGEDLAQRMTREPLLSLQEGAEILQQVCRALSAAHERDVLHRDLKPSNIFLCEDDEAGPFVKLLDFGIAKARNSLASLTGTEQLLGTPHYISPEMAQAQHHALGPQTDLFSLGVIAYELFAGARPFSGESIPALLYAVAHQTPQPPHQLRAGVPRPLSEFVMQLLTKDPEQRPKSAREVGATLVALACSATPETLVSGEGAALPLAPATPATRAAPAGAKTPATAPPTLATPADLSAPTRRRAPAILALASLAALAVLAGFFLIGRSNTSSTSPASGTATAHSTRQPATLDASKPAATLIAPAADASAKATRAHRDAGAGPRKTKVRRTRRRTPVNKRRKRSGEIDLDPLL
jgi:hypothetical protein